MGLPDAWSADALTRWLPLTEWLGLALPGSQADAAEPNSPARPLRAASTEVAQQGCGPAIGRHSVSDLYGRVLCAVACARIPLAQGWRRRSTRVLPAGAAQWRHGHDDHALQVQQATMQR